MCFVLYSVEQILVEKVGAEGRIGFGKSFVEIVEMEHFGVGTEVDFVEE